MTGAARTSSARRFTRRAALALAATGATSLATSSAMSAATSAAWWSTLQRLMPVATTAELVQRAAFSRPIGRWQAGDLPHAYPLPDGRVLWLLNDSFLSDAPDGPIDDRSRFVRNAAIMQTDSALELIDTGSSYAADGESRYDRWWWFHGGEIDGSLLHVVTTEMVRIGELGWAINFEPRSTWITTIAWRTMTILRMRPAPNSQVSPMYGFSVASDDEWTYLFGNSHIYGHATTENRVARVPRGKLLETPTYWDGIGWNSDPTTAVSVHTHGDWACRLHVVRDGDRWLATAKDEEFFGTDGIIWAADAPTGPWRELHRFTIPTRTNDDRTCTYDLMARPLGSGDLLVWWSNNSYEEDLARSDPRIYRPTFTKIEL
jgi:hypothetical protein